MSNMRFLQIIAWINVVVICLINEHYVYAGEIDSVGYKDQVPTSDNIAASSLFTTGKMVPTSYDKCTADSSCKPYVRDLNVKGSATNTPFTQTNSYQVKGYYLDNSDCAATVPGSWTDYSNQSISDLSKVCYQYIESGSGSLDTGNYSLHSSGDKYAIKVEYRNPVNSGLFLYLDLQTYANATSKFTTPYSDNNRQFYTNCPPLAVATAPALNTTLGANDTTYVNAYYLDNSGCIASSIVTVPAPVLNHYSGNYTYLYSSFPGATCLTKANVMYANYYTAHKQGTSSAFPINFAQYNYSQDKAGTNKYSIFVRYLNTLDPIYKNSMYVDVYYDLSTYASLTSNKFDNSAGNKTFVIQDYSASTSGIYCSGSYPTSSFRKYDLPIDATVSPRCVKNGVQTDMSICSSFFPEPTTTNTVYAKSCYIKNSLKSYYDHNIAATASCPNLTGTYYYCGIYPSTNPYNGSPYVTPDQCYINNTIDTDIQNCNGVYLHTFSAVGVTCFKNGLAQSSMTICADAHNNTPVVTKKSCYIASTVPDYYASTRSRGSTIGSCPTDSSTTYYYCGGPTNDQCVVDNVTQSNMTKCDDAYSNMISFTGNNITVNLLGSGSSSGYKNYTPIIS